MSALSPAIAATASSLNSLVQATQSETAQAGALIQILEESQARIEEAQASLPPATPPPLDGTGQVLDVSA